MLVTTQWGGGHKNMTNDETSYGNIFSQNDVTCKVKLIYAVNNFKDEEKTHTHRRRYNFYLAFLKAFL